MERIGNDLRHVLRGAGVPDAGQLAAVTRVWEKAVGPAVARAAWPQRIARDGTLLVATISATWANELSLLREEVAAKLTAALGDEAPSSLRFAVGLVPEPPADESKPRPAPLVPGPEDVESARRIAAAISDPELREAVRRAAAASLAFHRSDPSV
jgi:predicted nucleic acid-binding Zn ribbon protein